jgi:quercetin dioxygenase-like cupin family protein
MAKHIRWSDVAREELHPLLQRQYISTPSVTMARFLLRKGMVVSQHSHENEQVTYVTRGSLKLIFPDQEITVRAGEVVTIPPNEPHSAEALEECEAVDVFAPHRSDWEAKNDAYLRGK